MYVQVYQLGSDATYKKLSVQWNNSSNLDAALAMMQHQGGGPIVVKELTFVGGRVSLLTALQRDPTASIVFQAKRGETLFLEVHRKTRSTVKFAAKAMAAGFRQMLTPGRSHLNLRNLDDVVEAASKTYTLFTLTSGAMGAGGSTDLGHSSTGWTIADEASRILQNNDIEVEKVS